MPAQENINMFLNMPTVQRDFKIHVLVQEITVTVFYRKEEAKYKD